MTLRELQDQVGKWSRKNFGDQPADNPMLGVVEEVGELAHAVLKARQGIRGTAAGHNAAIADAVGDLIIYLADFCGRSGIDLQQAVAQAWSEVGRRDWTRFPKNGLTE